MQFQVWTTKSSRGKSWGTTQLYKSVESFVGQERVGAFYCTTRVAKNQSSILGLWSRPLRLECKGLGYQGCQGKVWRGGGATSTQNLTRGSNPAPCFHDLSCWRIATNGKMYFFFSKLVNWMLNLVRNVLSISRYSHRLGMWKFTTFGRTLFVR